MKFTLRAFYRRVYLSGAENIPENGAVILACNHPNAFMDAIVLCVLLDRPLHFLTRSDMFSTSAKRWLLEKINMLPIYRQQEGKENLHKNEEVFEKCHKMIAAGKVVSIFSEGNCVQEKKLRSLKKGTARLAFGTEEANNWEADLKVIPVGINYTHPSRFREELIISIGKPLEPHNWKEIYEAQPAKAANEFSAALFDALTKEIIILKNKATEGLFEKIIPLFRNNELRHMGPWLFENRQRLEMEQGVAIKINGLQDVSAHEKEAENYYRTLKEVGVSDLSVIQANSGTGLNAAALILLAPIALIGFIANFLPIYFGIRIATKKVREVEFFTSVAIAVMFFSYLAYYILLLAIGGLSFGMFGVLIAAGVPLYGMLCLHCLRSMAEFPYARRARKIRKTEAWELLSVQRQKILDRYS